MKKYDVYVAGSVKTDEIQATCITKACKEFIRLLGGNAKYKVISKEYATITNSGNYSIFSDFVVMEQ